MATADIKDTDDEILPRHKPPFLRRVRIRGYKSIAFCDVTLEPLTVLVGRNGSGKSNFLDALRLLSDVVRKGVPEAILAFGGWESIHCRSNDRPSVCIELESEFRLNDADLLARDEALWTATYSVEIESAGHGAPKIGREKLRLATADGHRWTRYDIDHGVVRWDGDSFVQPLYQWRHGGRVFLGIYDSEPFLSFRERLEAVGAYNFAPQRIRELQRPMAGSLLRKDGSNLASVITAVQEEDAAAFRRINQYVQAIVPEVDSVEPIHYGEFETVQFRMRGGTQTGPLLFDAANMSDGTLRVLASVMAVFQNVPPYGRPSVVGIEEPETALHPAAMNALVDALDEATLRTQVLITTHSTELLDNPTIKPKNVRVVEMVNGQTIIGPVDAAYVEIVHRNLGTLGELERDNRLEADLDDRERQELQQKNGQEPHQ